MKTLHKILPPTLLLGISALLSSLLGVLRDHLLAKTFGATSGGGIYNLDVYYAAFKIPDLLYFILVTGAFSAAFIPIFTRYKKEGELKKAWDFASNVLHIMLIVVSGVAFLAFIFAPYLAKLVASGFEPEAFALTVKLMRIMLLSPLIFTFSSVFIGLQDSFKTFFFRSLMPIFYNAGIIFSIVFFAQDFGVMGIAWGVILGAILSLLIQLPALKLIGYQHAWIFNLKKSDIQEVFKLMGPRILTLGMSQMAQVGYNFIASYLAVGSITILYFANNIYSLPLSMIAVAFSITSFATLSELAMKKHSHAFVLEIKRVMQQTLFLILPATVGLVLLRDEIIDTLLLAGKFTQADAILTSQVLFFMVLSLFTHSLVLLLTRGFYAYHDTKTPFYATFWGALVSIILASIFVFVLNWGVVAIGIAMGISNIITFLVLYFLMQKKVDQSILERMNVFKMLFAAITMGLGVYFFKQVFIFPESTVIKMIYLLAMALGGALIYFGMAYLLNIPERRMLFARSSKMKFENK